jgi:hypothetical protein
MQKPIEINFAPMEYGEVTSTVLLVTIDEDGDKKLKSLATGFFAISPPYVVLVTAAHVFNGLVGKPVIAIGKNGSVSLAKAKLVKSDKFDIAVAFFETNDLSILFDAFRCPNPLIIKNVLDSGVSAIYQLHGFPAAKNEISKTTGLNGYQLRLTFGESKEIPKQSSFVSTDLTPFCFEISPKKLVDDNAEPDYRFGSFKGLSGSPVYRYDASDDKTKPANLIGMFVEWHNVSKTAVVVPWEEIDKIIQISDLIN